MCFTSFGNSGTEVDNYFYYVIQLGISEFVNTKFVCTEQNKQCLEFDMFLPQGFRIRSESIDM